MSHKKEHIFICVCVSVSVCVCVSGRHSWEKKEKRKKSKEERKEKEKREKLIHTDKHTDRRTEWQIDRHKSFIDMRYNTEQYGKSNPIESNSIE